MENNFFCWWEKACRRSYYSAFLKVPLSGLRQFLLTDKLFKSDEKFFSFHLKSSFCHKGIYIYVLTFLIKLENSLIRKPSLISTFKTSQTGKQITAIHVLPKYLKLTLAFLSNCFPTWLKYLGNQITVIHVLPKYLKLTLAFLPNCFPTWLKNLGQKFNYFKTKRALRWNKKNFSSFVKGFHWSQ